MTIEIKKRAKDATIEVAGRLDTITAPVLENTISENIASIKTATPTISAPRSIAICLIFKVSVLRSI